MTEVVVLVFPGEVVLFRAPVDVVAAVLGVGVAVLIAPIANTMATLLRLATHCTQNFTRLDLLTSALLAILIQLFLLLSLLLLMTHSPLRGQTMRSYNAFDRVPPRPQQASLSQDLSTGRTIGSGREVDSLYRLDRSPSSLCRSYELGKNHRVSFPSRVVSRVDSLFQLVHSDLWGPSRVASNNGFSCSIKCLRTDNAREFFSIIDGFQDYLSSHGIIHQSSCAYTSQQNGVAERKLRYLLEVARTLLFQIQVPKFFWSDAILTARFLPNRLPSSVLNGDSPFHNIYPHQDPFPLMPCVFGCVDSRVPRVDRPPTKFQYRRRQQQAQHPHQTNRPHGQRSPYRRGLSSSICRLRKSIYGLKQSLRAWFDRFSEAVMMFGLKQCAVDHSVFSYQSSTGCIMLIVYVDDIIITGSDLGGIRKLKAFLQKEFTTKDLGHLRYFLGIEVGYSSSGLSLSQRKYVLNLLEETGNLGVKPVAAPMDPNVKLVPEDGDLLKDPGRYRRLVGKLIYLTVTRPDISYAVGVVSQYMTSPRTSHWNAVVQILKYLKGAPGKGLLFKRHGHT
ncbi:uncharacterized protein LOC143891919 [Tasmannia lanceolata]|uniref:uncharacterized protein LOC143891919 n=1 Tax=Tasmannia lanceolata TaxID=3420 RepID=UPI004063EABA